MPSHLESPLLHELRGIRRRYAVKAFPLAVLVVSGLSALIFLVKGRALVELILEIFYTTDKDEQNALERWGLQPCKEP